MLAYRQSLHRIQAVIQAELRSLARQKTPFVLRTAYAALAAAIILQFGWIQVPGTTGQTMASASYRAFFSMAWIQMILAMFVGAMLGVASAYSERHNRTLGLLVLSQLAPGEVMLGKLLALLGLVMSVMLGALPVFAIIGWAGGLEYGWLGALALLTGVVAAQGIAVGLAAGFRWRSGTGAAFAAVILLATLTFLSRLMDPSCLTTPLYLLSHVDWAMQKVATQGQVPEEDRIFGLGLLVSLAWTALMMRVGSQALPRAAAGGGGRGLRGVFEKLDAFFEDINVGGIRLGSGQPRPPRGNPVAWLGRTSAGLGLPQYGFRLLTLALLLSCWSLVLVLDGGRWARPVILFWAGVVTVMGLAAGAATFGEEKARGNFGVLLSTPLSARAILRGKLLITLRLVLVVGTPVVALLAFWGSVDRWMPWEWQPFVVYFLAGPVCGYLLARHLSLLLVSSLRASVGAGLLLASMLLLLNLGQHPFWQRNPDVVAIGGVLTAIAAAVGIGVWAERKKRPGIALVAFLAALATVLAAISGMLDLRLGEWQPWVPLMAALGIDRYTVRAFDRVFGAIAVSSEAAAELLDGAFLRRLEGLALRAPRRYDGRQAGAKRTLRRGVGLEFADHRAYVAGDDLRHLDWPLLGRLGRPFVKTYEQEQDLQIHLLVDTSRSMAFGQPGKWLAAARLAAALAHVGLASLDRVGAALFDGRGLRLHAPSRGQGALLPLLRFLATGAADGPAGGAAALKLHAAAARPGLCVVLSDFLDPDFEVMLRPHLLRRHSLVLIQVLAPQELDPELEGDFELRDAENGERLDVTLGARELAAYRRRLADHRRSLERFARRYRAEFFSFSSAQGLEAVVEALWHGSFFGRG